MRLSGRDNVLAIVPMFHALGWCLPYAAAMLGARMVLPHRDLSPERILDLVTEHRVTTAVVTRCSVTRSRIRSGERSR